MEQIDQDKAQVKVTAAQVEAARASIQVNEAAVQRFTVLQDFQKITAPFPGVITARNVDPGDLLTADRVVGYNIDRFDIEVLRGYTGRDLSRIRTRDMLADIYRKLGFRLRLADVAEATLGTGKSSDGLQSLQWWKEGRIDLIEEYCRKDVEVTRNVFQFGVANGYILYRDKEGRALRLPVDWK